MNYKYKDFRDWLYEEEGFGVRISRLVEDVEYSFGKKYHPDEFKVLMKWLEAAFECGREQK